jgi:hypothetical protein
VIVYYTPVQQPQYYVPQQSYYQQPVLFTPQNSYRNQQGEEYYEEPVYSRGQGFRNTLMTFNR